MILRQRNLELKNVHLIKSDKRLIILDWLLEFRFSNACVLSLAIGTKPSNNYRLLKRFTEIGYIQKFKNIHTDNKKYYFLSKVGADFLSSEGRDVDHAVTNPMVLSKYSTIMHDLYLQEAIINRIHLFKEVIWERNIPYEPGIIRPDALLKSNNNIWLALEFERWAKSKPRIYSLFIRHLYSIASDKYSGVLFIMDDAASLRKYQTYFNEKSWPVYKKIAHSRYKKHEDTIDPSSIVSNHHDKFSFTMHEKLVSQKTI